MPPSAMMETYARSGPVFDRGEGAFLLAADGRRFLDFASGIAVTSLGHGHKGLVNALATQAGRLWHIPNLCTPLPIQENLAVRLCTASGFADRVFFCNSGAEANECAIKTARKYQSATGHPGRWRTVVFTGAFHGRTLAMIAAGDSDFHRAGFGPPVDGFDRARLHDTASVEAAIGPGTAAIMIEPIQGESGINVVDADFLRFLRETADRHGLLLILDEIQCGMGRTGHLFASQAAGITPDIMTLAKGMGGGFPLGACLATLDACQGMTPGTHGSTYGGNCLGMACGHAVLDVLLPESLTESVRQSGTLLAAGLEEMVAACPGLLSGVRGRGLLLGVLCRKEGQNLQLVAAAQQEGLLLAPASNNVVRLLPPLTIGTDELHEGLARFRAACHRLATAGDAP